LEFNKHFEQVLIVDFNFAKYFDLDNFEDHNFLENLQHQVYLILIFQHELELSENYQYLDKQGLILIQFQIQKNLSMKGMIN
jgi:hypothetical protein